jgi:sugar-phosphatase
VGIRSKKPPAQRQPPESALISTQPTAHSPQQKPMTSTPFPNRSFDAFLFDMDGTLISSLASAERCWAAWARSHGLDVAAFLPTIHGRRAEDTVRQLGLPGVDPVVEAAAIAQAEMNDVADIQTISGAAAFLASLPAAKWAIVTSAPRELARLRLEAAGLPFPHLMIAAEDIANGKPAPDCFLLAAEKLGVRIANCLVFEDAPAGIAAAEAAGASVLVISAMHTHPLATSHPQVVNYDGLRSQVVSTGSLQIEAID